MVEAVSTCADETKVPVSYSPPNSLSKVLVLRAGIERSAGKGEVRDSRSVFLQDEGSLLQPQSPRQSASGRCSLASCTKPLAGRLQRNSLDEHDVSQSDSTAGQRLQIPKLGSAAGKGLARARKSISRRSKGAVLSIIGRIITNSTCAVTSVSEEALAVPPTFPGLVVQEPRRDSVTDDHGPRDRYACRYNCWKNLLIKLRSRELLLLDSAAIICVTVVVPSAVPQPPVLGLS